VEEYYKRSIDIYTKHYGKNDPNVSKTKNNLASAYLREGKYKLAVQLYQQILSDSQSTLNSNRDSTTIMTTFKNLGNRFFSSF
jgi:pentatricopeptide repeat protein